MLPLTALALVPRFLLGLLVIAFIWREAAKSRLLALFLAGPLGAGISSLLSFLWIWAGGDLGEYARTETAFILATCLVWLWTHRTSTWFTRPVPPSPPRASGLALWLAVGLAAVMFATQFWLTSLQRPHGGWDAWVHWNVVSRFVYRGGADWQATFQRVFDEPDYPLLLAMTNATTWELLGRESTRGPMFAAFLFTSCLVGLSFAVVREFRGSPQASLLVIVLLTQPLLLASATSQYADVPAAFYFLAAPSLCLLYIRSREPALAVLAGLALGLGAWSKNEGIVFAATSLGVWAWLSWRHRRPAIKDLLLGAAAPLAILGLFKVFLAPHAALSDNLRTMMLALADPARYLLVLGQLVSAFWREIAASPVAMIAVIVYACLLGRARQQIAGLAYLIALFAAQSAAYLLIYVGTPATYGTSTMIPTSVGRLFIHVLPLGLLALFLWIKPSEEVDTPDAARGDRGLHPRTQPNS